MKTNSVSRPVFAATFSLRGFVLTIHCVAETLRTQANDNLRFESGNRSWFTMRSGEIHCSAALFRASDGDSVPDKLLAKRQAHYGNESASLLKKQCGNSVGVETIGKACTGRLTPWIGDSWTVSVCDASSGLTTGTQCNVNIPLKLGAVNDRAFNGFHTCIGESVRLDDPNQATRTSQLTAAYEGQIRRRPQSGPVANISGIPSPLLLRQTPLPNTATHAVPVISTTASSTLRKFATAFH